MRVCILGLGYVGTVAGACLADQGCRVLGVDIDEAKVDLFAQGRPSFVEPGLDELLARGKTNARIDGTTDSAHAITTSDIVIITVGTPAGRRGKPDMTALAAVADQIGGALRERDPASHCTVVLRSTVPPGTTREYFIPRVERAAGRRHGDGWAAVFSPEFLREGVAIDDFRNPPQTIVGCVEQDHAQPYLDVLANIDAPVRRCQLETAELMKYACNCFHAVKIAFANELGVVARAVGADGREVMELVCQDKVLNISSAYMRPGNAFGGSCLPKDLKGLNQIALEQQVRVPLLASVMSANQAQIDRLVDAVKTRPSRKVGIVGITFKDDTDDLRDSPMVAVVRELLLDQYDLRVWDRNLKLGALRGRNLQFARMGIPQLADILVEDIAELAQHCGTIVLGRKIDSSNAALVESLKGVDIVDVVDQPELRQLKGYEAVFW